MPLKKLNCSVTDSLAEVIVNPTDSRFSGAGGADMAIHKAAGTELDMESGVRRTSSIFVKDSLKRP